MNKISHLAASAALALCASSANAWWGGPGGWGNGNDWLGDGFGDMDFSMNFSGRGNSWGRGNNYYAPYYYGYAPYGYAPVAPYGVAPDAPEAMPAAPADPMAFHENQMKAFQEAAEAQRNYLQNQPMRPEMAERIKQAEERREAMRASRPNFGFERPDMDARIKQAQQHRDEMMKRMDGQRMNPGSGMGAGRPGSRQSFDERRQAMQQQMDARRQEQGARSATPNRPEMDARRQAMQQQMDARRQEMQAMHPAMPEMPMPDMDAQRQMMDQNMQAMQQQMDAMRPASPFPQMDSQMNDRIKAAEAQREQMRKQMEERRDQMRSKAAPAAPTAEQQAKPAKAL